MNKSDVINMNKSDVINMNKSDIINMNESDFISTNESDVISTDESDVIDINSTGRDFRFNFTGNETKPIVSYLMSDQREFVMLFCGFGILSSVCVNALLMARIVQRQGFVSSLRHALIFNLSVVDILMSLIVNSYMLDVLWTGSWAEGILGCPAFGVNVVLLGSVGGNTLSLFSLERLLFISRKLENIRERAPMSFLSTYLSRDPDYRKYAALMVSSCWLVGVGLTLPLLFGWSSFELVDDWSTTCTLNPQSRDFAHVTYTLVYFLATVLGPLWFNYATYRMFDDKIEMITRMVQVNRRHSSLGKLALRVSRNSRVSIASGCSVSSTSSVVLRDIHNYIKRPVTSEVINEKQVVRLLSLIGAGSSMARLPYGILTVGMSITDGRLDDLLVAAFVLFMLTSSAHPVCLLLCSDRLGLHANPLFRCPRDSSVPTEAGCATSTVAPTNRMLMTRRTIRVHSAPENVFNRNPVPITPSPSSLTPIIESNHFPGFSPCRLTPASSAQKMNNSGLLSLTDIRSETSVDGTSTQNPSPEYSALSGNNSQMMASPCSSRLSPKVERFFGETIGCGDSGVCSRMRDNSIPEVIQLLEKQPEESGESQAAAANRNLNLRLEASPNEISKFARCPREQKYLITSTHLQSGGFTDRQLPYVA